MPVYFRAVDDAISHAEKARKLLKGLPGVDSMRVEASTPDGRWLQLWPEQLPCDGASAASADPLP